MAGRKSSAGRKTTTRQSKAGGKRKSTARKSKAGSGRRQSQRRKSVKSGMSKGKDSQEDKKGDHRSSAVDVPYAPTTLNVSSIYPFFLLLRSNERSLILKALNYIYKHIKYNFEEVKLMYEKTYMEDVKELTKVSEKVIPDSALRLLALITKDPASHKYLINDDEYINLLYGYFSSKTESQVKFSSKILSDLTKDIDFTKRIARDGSGFDMKLLVNNLSHSSADVCHNTMVIIGNIFHDLPSAEKFVNLKEFSYVPFFNLLESPYVEVQKKALTLIEWLGCQKKTTELKDRFIDQKGVERIFGVLMNIKWRDIHAQALKVLRAFLETDEDRMRTLENSGVGKFVSYIDFCEDDVLIANVLGNILDIATTVFGKLELVQLGFVPKVTAMLSDGTVEMKLEACNIMNEMFKNIETVRLFTELAPVPEIVDIIADPDHSWELVGAAMGVLHNLVKFSVDMAFLIFKNPQMTKLLNFVILNLMTIPIKYKNVLYDLLSVILQHDMLRSHTLQFKLVWVFLLGLRDTNPKLHHVQEVSAEALYSTIPHEKYTRQFLVAANGMEIVTRALINAKHPQLISMLCNLVRVAAENDDNMLILLLKLRVLDWLVKKRRMWTELEPMEWAATALQNRFLPAKFEYRGRLAFTDITKNGFYIRKEYDSPENLPVPPHKVNDQGVAPYTVYIANFELEKDRITPAKAAELYSEKLKRNSELDEKCAATYQFEQEETSNLYNEIGGYDLTMDPLYMRRRAENDIILEDDERLISLYEDVKRLLQEADDKYGVRDYSMPFDHSWVLSRVEALVDVVTRALGGTETTQPCHNHNINLYIEELKTSRRNGVIPMGSLQMGGSLERALLFKILADKVGLPCSLWRGAHGNGWNEIPLLNLGVGFPERNKEETKIKTEDKPEMPTRLMYPTHVVDLIDKAGRLLEVGSPEALHYTGRPVQSELYKVLESQPPCIDTCLIKIKADD